MRLIASEGDPMARLAWSLAVLSILAGAPAARAAPPERRTGTATVKAIGGKGTQGTFKAICGAYFMADVPGTAKAGDGILFETTIPELGSLQVTAWKKQAGPVKEGGILLNTPDGSYMADHASGAKVVVGADLFSATVEAVARAFPRARKGKPAEYRLDVKFECPK
jgi:hypothetical protein